MATFFSVQFSCFPGASLASPDVSASLGSRCSAATGENETEAGLVVVLLAMRSGGNHCAPLQTTINEKHRKLRHGAEHDSIEQHGSGHLVWDAGCWCG